MKKLEYRIAAMFVGLVFILSSCGDDGLNPGPRSTPVTDDISGSTSVEVSPLAQTYSVPLRTGSSYAWSAAGVGTISGEATGNSISVLFGSAGTTTLTVTETNDEGTASPVTLDVTSAAGALGVASVTTLSAIPLKAGDQDTVVIVFNKEVATAPSLSLSPGLNILTLGTLSSATGTAIDAADAATFGLGSSDELANGELAAYWVRYTAGTGNGNPVLNISGAVAATTWGGATMSAATSTFNTIDNTAPSPKLSYSASLVKEGDDAVGLTVTFAEEVDSTLLVITATLGAVNWTGDTLNYNPDDPTTWTATFPVPTGNGSPTFTITAGATDASGNVGAATAITPSALTFTVDNTAPTLTTLAVAERSSDSNQASLTGTSSESSEVFYTVVEDGTAVADTDAVQDFSIAVENGSTSTATGAISINTGILASGAYDVYFFAVDDVGNVGALSAKLDLTID